MIRSTDIEDTYKGGAFLRQWSVDSSGQCICAVDAHATANVEQDTLDATTASNAKIRVALAAVDGLEAAKRVPEPDGEIPKTVSETDIDGNVTERPYKAWAEYDVAQVTIAAASDATNQFALVRSMGVQSETLPKTETTTEPILDEEGNDSGETREVVTVVKGETITNPDYAAYKAAWDAVDADLN
tara:strand:+ start:79 stop:636 length:558 start_codon:yes stop_codon:yes gene_type:complete